MTASFDLHCGDALDVLPRLTPRSVDCIVTSPPYAEQRKADYGGVHERIYPTWLADRLDAAKPALTDRASVAIVIRPHIRGGQLSDYVLRTRLELRERGWVEVDEWIWDKGSGMPTAPNDRPRRSWEHILWFAPSRTRPWCDPRANGRPQTQPFKVEGRLFRNGYGRHKLRTAPYVPHPIARGIDLARIRLGQNITGDEVAHPAPFPPALAAWIIRYVCPPGGRVLDPFAGSGSTGLAALAEDRAFHGHRHTPGVRRPHAPPVDAAPAGRTCTRPLTFCRTQLHMETFAHATAYYRSTVAAESARTRSRQTRRMGRLVVR
ncbi:site-specific DNA-methyltransferase [Glycomyces sp. A-F 0318]|uniref:DNA-methyltransferase n=1 Tax=Glycomyces amatae TaxID=2881355 RepID=UPI001E656521|nr:site-specific DNA-methyltransferase [Glycomyces amatae]MCD0446472.1 site-specific DNA-methyltransferase [Glycomyces amatae]